ncbi:MAG: ribosome recycling factor [Parcubacteria group bacterium Gr01-1014_72]|nr:MAG: ribosome recycling factor [Parcubacteria group bacterium Gr01-1014_72]
MAYTFTAFTKKAKETEEWLKKELSAIRTSRATPALLDGVSVEAYGSRMPLKQAGTISIEDARTLRVTPFDMALMKDIEKAVVAANLGLSGAADERGIRITFPELTSERRASLVKVVKEKLLQARISLRKFRDEVWNDIQKQEKAGSMSEDEKFRAKKELEKLAEAFGKALGEGAQRKEKEIMN